MPAHLSLGIPDGRTRHSIGRLRTLPDAIDPAELREQLAGGRGKAIAHPGAVAEVLRLPAWRSTGRQGQHPNATTAFLLPVPQVVAQVDRQAPLPLLLQPGAGSGDRQERPWDRACEG